MKDQKPDALTSHHAAEKPGISRRLFLKGAASLVTMGFCEYLPRVEDGCLFPVYDALAPTKAYGQTIVHGEQTYEIEVVSYKEVGILVLDVSKTPPTPVAGAKVNLARRGKDHKSVDFVTNEKGKYILDLTELADPDENGNYRFNATIDVTSPDSPAPQMRDFSTGMMVIKGANAVVINVHALEGNETYIERLTFDEWDAHYTVNEFYRSSANQEGHELLVRLANASGDVEMTLTNLTTPKWPSNTGGGYTATAVYDPKTGLATASFKKCFLLRGDPACLIESENTLRIMWGDGQYSDAIINVKDAPIDDYDLGVDLTPLTHSSEGIKITWPTGAKKIFKDISFSVWTPRIPVNVEFTPTNLLLGIGIDNFLADTDDGAKDVNGWKHNPSDYFKDGYEKALQKKRNKLDDLIANKGFVNKKTGKITKHTFSKNFSANMAMEAVLNLDWKGLVEKDGKHYKHFDGKFTAAIDMTVGVTFTGEYLIGVFPLFWSLGIELFNQDAFVFLASVNTPEDGYTLPVNKTIFSFDSVDPLVVKLNFTLTFSAGAGVSGILSVGVSASPSLFIYLGILTKAVFDDNEKKWPHVIVGYAFKAEVFVQAIIFKLSATIWSIKNDHWYDNWAKTSDTMRVGDELWQEGEARFMFTQNDGTWRHSVICGDYDELLLGEPSFDAFKLVTNAELGESSEFTATPVGADEQEPIVAVPTVVEGKMVWPVRGEDGSVTLELVDCADANTFVFDGTMGAQDEAASSGEGDLEAASSGEGDLETASSGEGDLETASSGEGELEAASSGEDDLEAVDAQVDASPDVESLNDEALQEMPEEPGDEVAIAAEGAEVVLVDLSEDGEPYVAPVVNEAIVPASDETTSPEHAAVTAVPEADAPATDATFDKDYPYDVLLGSASSVARSGMREYSYEYTGTPVEDLPTAVLGIATHGGVAVRDKLINKNVFSDPHVRYGVVAGVVYMFRIVTVTYKRLGGSVNRSRLAAAPFDVATGTWGEYKVLEYGSDDPNLPRVDIFDYDFDIAYRPKDATWVQGACACIVVSGGMRPRGDESTIREVFASPTITVLLVDGSMNVVVRSVRRVGDVYNDKLVHMVTSPRVADHYAMDGISGVLAFSYIHRSAATVDDILSPTGATASLASGFVSMTNKAVSIVLRTSKETQIDQASQSLDLVVGSPKRDAYDALATYILQKQGGYDIYSARVPTGGKPDDIIVAHNIQSTQTLPGLQAWPGRGTLLLTHGNSPDAVDDHLYEGTYDVNVTGAAALSETLVDLEGYGGGAFTMSPNGNYLFFIDGRQGEGPVEGVDPNTGEPIKSVDNIYRIKASKFIDGKFCPAFPFGEIDHPIDSLVSVAGAGKASNFITSQITDADKSLASLYYMSVPHSKVVEVQGICLLDPFACAGSPCQFQVTLHNHGNLVITGFELALCDADDNDNVVSTATVGKIELENIMYTARNCKSADKLTAASEEGEEELSFELRDSLQNGQLIPGTPLDYAVSFDIPKTWEGKRNVVVRVTQAWASETDLALTEGADVYTLFNEGAGGSVDPLRVTVTSTPYDPNEGRINNDSGGGDSGGGSHRNQCLPKTGDGFAGLGPLSLGIGALGAGLVAYGRRRQQVERENLLQEE